MHIDIGPEVFNVSSSGLGPVAQYLLGHVACASGEDFHAVTGRKYDAFAHCADAWQCPVFLIAMIGQGEAFAHVHSGGAVIQAHKKDITVHNYARVSAG